MASYHYLKWWGMDPWEDLWDTVKMLTTAGVGWLAGCWYEYVHTTCLLSVFIFGEKMFFSKMGKMRYALELKFDIFGSSWFQNEVVS